MFHKSFKEEDALRLFHDFQGCFQRVPECFKSVSRMFHESLQGVSKKFHVAWNSSQLPEQMEGLFFYVLIA